MKKPFILALCLVWPGIAMGAKVIMKDGKIYEGKIVAETDGDVLIKTSPVDRPKLLPVEEILTVVRDPVRKEPPDVQRYTGVQLRLIGNVYSSKNISLDPAPGLALDGIFRFLPAMEFGAGLEWTPALSGKLEVTDGTTARGYESFFSYGGGLWTKIYPLAAVKRWTWEPFLTFGYHWTNLLAKGSGDSLKGGGIQGGIGAQRLWKKNVYVEAGLLYHHDSYGVIHFSGTDGALDPKVRVDSYSFSSGLSLHF